MNTARFLTKAFFLLSAVMTPLHANAVIMSLKDAPVNEPVNLPAFLKSTDGVTVDPDARLAAMQLGKALFWDMRLGTDNVNACATCHFNAGADPRFKNQLEPGFLSNPLPGRAGFPYEALIQPDLVEPAAKRNEESTFGNTGIPGQVKGPNEAPFRYGFGLNFILKAVNFPFHRRSTPTDPGDGFYNTPGAVLMDTNDIVSSQGIRKSNVTGGRAAEPRDQVFSWRNRNIRRVATRNSPSAVNSGFFYDMFWDGRASNVFNGKNPFGFRDDVSKVDMVVNGSITPMFVRIPMLPNASQSVGPPLSDRELSGHSRDFLEVAEKFLRVNKKPLALQNVHPNDSVFSAGNASIVDTRPGTEINPRTRRVVTTPPRGLTVNYDELIRRAFKPEWWESATSSVAGYNQMEANFPMFFGIATALYQMSLVSDDTPYDRVFGAGNDFAAVFDAIALAGGCVGPNGEVEDGAPGAACPVITQDNVADLVIGQLPLPLPRGNVPAPVDPNAMTAQQWRGFEVYQRSLCFVCHVLPETSNAVQRLATVTPQVVGWQGSPWGDLVLNGGEIIDPNTGEKLATEFIDAQLIFGVGTANPANPLDIIAPITGQLEVVVNSPTNPYAVMVPLGKIELMPIAKLNPDGTPIFGNYDVGFYNLGVRPTEEDIARANTAPPTILHRDPLTGVCLLTEEAGCSGFQLSYSELGLVKYLSEENDGLPLPKSSMGKAGVADFIPDFGIGAVVNPDPLTAPLVPFLEVAGAPLDQLFNPNSNPLATERMTVRGAFKTPIIRNQAYQGPYFHNGGDSTLRHVVEFYARGGNFPITNQEYLTADMAPLALLDIRNNPAAAQNIADLVEFLANGLVDQRVVRSAAPFDHPEIRIPVGENRSTLQPESFTNIAATGAAGSNVLASRFLGLNPQSR